jgi:nitroreductase
MIKEIEDRRSIRKYKDQPVPEDVLNDILESARLAPSGSNTQPWRFIVVRSKETREKLSRADHNQSWMLTAPVLIVCVADPRCQMENDDGSKAFSVNEESPEMSLKRVIRDVSIAVEHMALEAVSQGLGTCWTGWYEQDGIRPVLNIPEDKYVCCVLTLGYPDEAPAPRPRKPMEELVRYETW